jgi:hypothetical protein
MANVGGIGAPHTRYFLRKLETQGIGCHCSEEHGRGHTTCLRKVVQWRYKMYDFAIPHTFQTPDSYLEHHSDQVCAQQPLGAVRRIRAACVAEALYETNIAPFCIWPYNRARKF